MPIGDKLWTNWNKALMMLWQSQLNFAMWCTSSACGVSSEHLKALTDHFILTVEKLQWKRQQLKSLMQTKKSLRKSLVDQDCWVLALIY